LEPVLLLAPQGVCDLEAKVLPLCVVCARIAAVQLLGEGVEGRMQPLLRQADVQRAGHLPFRLAARAGIGHAQGEGEAVGRVDRVAVPLGPQGLIEVQSKGCVALHEFGKLGNAYRRRRLVAARREGKVHATGKTGCFAGKDDHLVRRWVHCLAGRLGPHQVLVSHQRGVDQAPGAVAYA